MGQFRLLLHGCLSYPVNYPVPMTELKTLEGHGHPRLDVSSLEDESAVLDDCFQISIEVFEDEIEVGLI